MPLFSIIVVSLNTKYQFLKTINSIKNQTFKKYEVVIVDGKSKDGTIDEIKKMLAFGKELTQILKKQ